MLIYFKLVMISLHVMSAQPIVEEEPEEPQWETYEITAYTAGYESTGKRPGDKGYGITYSGEEVQEEYTIACPKEIDLYTQIEIEGVGVRTCTDRGGAIKGKKLDIYMENLSDALDWGRRNVNIRIIQSEKES